MTTKEKAREVYFAVRGDPAWLARDAEFAAAFGRGDTAAAETALAAMTEAFDAAVERLLAAYPADERGAIGVELNLLAARACGAI